MNIKYWLAFTSFILIIWCTATYAGNFTPIFQDAHYKDLDPIEAEGIISNWTLVILVVKTPLFPIMGLVVDKFK